VGSTFYIDPFNIVSPSPPPSRQNDSPLNMFSTSSLNYKNNNQSTFYIQPTAQFVPSRPPPPVPVVAAAPPSIVNTAIQKPLTLKNLRINTPNEVVTDLLDLGDPGSPPPSPKFDPYG
jgi:hypothetical protein